MNPYEDFAVRDAIASLSTENAELTQRHMPVRKALGLSVHQGIEHNGNRGAVYYVPACGVDAEKARFSNSHYRQVDQLITCPKCIALDNA